MKRLQNEFEEVQKYKKLGEGGAHEHEDLPHVSASLAAACTENAKLKYQLNILHTVTNAETSPQKSSSFPSQGHYAENVLALVSDVLASAIAKAFPGVSCDPCVVPCNAKIANPGTYQCNAAMTLCKELRGRADAPKSPRDVALKIVSCAEPSDVIEKLEVAGAGFINIHVHPLFMAAQITKIMRLGVLPPKVAPLKVVVDYSSPNIAKEMHVGHLRSTIIGDCLAHVMRFVGHDVLALNHVGDWGTQFGMLIAHLKDQFPNFSTESPPIEDLQSFYKASKVRFDEDKEFNKRAHDEVVKLQSGDPLVTQAWRLICDVSRKEFSKIYERLDIVGLQERGESYYHTRMQAVIKQITAQSLLEDDQDPAGAGRKIMWTESHTIPLILVKSDGGFTYDTSDMAALKCRIEEDRAQWLVYVVDAGQSQHFTLVFEGSRRCGFYDPAVHRVDHVAFGVVLGADGKKFKTRSGDTVRLKDLLDEGVLRAKETLAKKAEERQVRGQEAIEMTEEEQQKVNEAVAYGCIKYADLSHSRTNDYIFSFDKMLDEKGNTAVYLLYAFTRICSIVRQPAVRHIDLTAAAATTTIVLEHPKELQIAKLLIRFPEVISKILKDLLPHSLCDYLFELSTAFHELYDNCYVIEKDLAGEVKSVNTSRLLLYDATARVMERCFALLGIRTVEKM